MDAHGEECNSTLLETLIVNVEGRRVWVYALDGLVGRGEEIEEVA